jgi:hypothetical protein
MTGKESLHIFEGIRSDFLKISMILPKDPSIITVMAVAGIFTDGNALSIDI